MTAALILDGASWNTMVFSDELPPKRSATIFGARYVETVGCTGIGKGLAAKALGMKATLQCVLGADDRAKRIVSFCSERGLPLIIDTNADAPTAHHLNLMDAKGQRVSYLLDTGPEEPFVDRVRLKPHIAAADIIFASLTRATHGLLDLVSESSALVHSDLHDWDGLSTWHNPFIENADIVQLSLDALHDPDTTAGQMLGKRPKEVIVTHAQAGATVYTKEGRLDLPSLPATLVDSNGAGDAFAVAWVVARRSGKTLAEAGAYAAAAAAITVESQDIIPASLSDETIRARLGQAK